MDGSLLDEFIKKDDDVVITQESSETFIIESELFADEDNEDSESNILIDEANGTSMDVPIQLIRILFMVNCGLSALIITGFIPYQFLIYDESKDVAIGLMVGIIMSCFILYIFMAIFKRTFFALFFLSIWTLSYYACIITIAAVMRDFSPLQFGLISFLQSISIIVYTVLNPTYVDAWKSFYIMTIVGIVGWAVGIYAFIMQNDWVQASILFLSSILSAAYSSLQIKYVTRYSLSTKDCIEAVVRFYADPIIVSFEWIKNKIFS